MLTKESTKSEIQKAILRIVMKQNDKFLAQDIVEDVVELFEGDFDYQLVENIVYKTLDYCRREIHLLDVNYDVFEINHERKELVGSFLNHEGVTI